MDIKPEQKRDRLASLLQAKATRESDHPLSWAQERMWFLVQLEPGGAYNLVAAKRLQMRLDPGVLARAVNAIVERHEALRTVFPVVDGRPVQRVLTDVDVPVTVVELGGESGGEIDELASDLVEQENARLFSLESGPLIRVTVAQLGKESVLIIAVHHIVIDGWSFDILLEELNATYRAFRLGGQPKLPDLELQYPDWSRWQRRWLTETRMLGQLDYWKGVLADAPPIVDWPTAHPRPPRRSGHGAAHQSFLVDELTTRLLVFGREQQATPFMTVLAGYVALLSRWTGERDFVIGTPVANRPRAELHDLIGLFLNTLPLRVRCESGVTFRELVGRVREATLGALAHQDLPFERLVQDLRPVRDLSHTPIFQTMFVLRSVESNGAAAEQEAAPPISTSKFDLSINAVHRGNVIDLLWEYSTDLFDGETVVALSEAFPGLLAAACAKPDLNVDELAVEQGAILDRGIHLGSKVTVRGFVIDTSRVAESIRRHPGVETVRVGVESDEAGEAELVARVALSDPAVSEEELRRAAAAELPAYQLPARIVVDGAAVAEAEAAPASLALSPVEAQLEAIWAEILGVERVGRDENFFELGGHSIAAARVIARVRDRFKQEVPLRTIFEAPTIARLAAELPKSAAISAAPLVRVPRTGELPLSFAQERLWFLAQFNPESGAYNVPEARWLGGAVDPEVVERALAIVVSRHEVLRTTYPSVDGRPTQLIHPELEVPLAIHDLTDLPAEAALAEARRLSDVEADTPFDLAEGPLVRAALVRLRSDAHLLLLTVHHIAIDGWSLNLLFSELDSVRAALAQGHAPELPALDVQYADWAKWQRQSLSGPRLDALLDFWRTTLDGAPRLLDLPVDHPQRGTAEPRGATCAFWFDAELRRRIEHVSRQKDATPFMTILAGLALVLSRWSRHDDLVIGSPVACRTSAAIERLVGLFVNTLPLRLRVQPDDTFATLVERARETTLQALAHQDLPFERLVEDLRPDRSLSRNPLFQVMLVVQNNPRHWADSARVGDDVQPAPPPGRTAKFDLSFFVNETADRYQVGVEYAADLFERVTIERLGNRFTHLLREALADVDAPLESVSAFDAAESETLDSWSAGGAATETPTVVDLVLAQAAARPDAVAVAMGGESLSYSQLVALAHEIAGRLAPHVTCDRPVGLCVSRSPRGIAAMLAILLSGGAYLPLDPAYPRPRLELMVDSARPSVLVVESATKTLLTADVVTVDLDEEGATASPRPLPACHSDQLCYVMFTSGSQGAPKAVAMPHRVLANLVDWQIRRSALEPGAVTGQFAPWSFDVSAQEIFSTLGGGGTLTVVDDAERRDPALLWKRVRDSVVQRLFLPPVALYGFAASAPKILPEILVEVNVAGETLVVDADLRALAMRATGLSLRNQYGPLETHVVTEHVVTADLALPPVGRPIPGSVAHVLDERLERAPIGAVGELHLGGSAVSRNYLGRPDLTAERFVPDPFSSEPGARLYRTGDLARWRFDGSLEVLGRVDDQLKIRGFRVEPGEVEAAIRGFPGIAATVVTARGPRPQQSLCATVVMEDGVPFDAAALTGYLRTVLPDHLVPSVVLPSDRLPVTASGKVDRRAAAKAADATQPARRRAAAQPRTPTELELAAIWCEVLDVPAVGLDDDFFDLGGHSLLATQVVARILSRLGVEIGVRTLFEQPVLGPLAAAVTEARAEEGCILA